MDIPVTTPLTEGIQLEDPLFRRFQSLHPYIQTLNNIDSAYKDRMDINYKTPEITGKVKGSLAKRILQDSIDSTNIDRIVFMTRKPRFLCIEAYRLTNDVTAAIKMLT